MPGEREEHVVERRPADLDVEHVDTRVVERSDHARDDPVARSDRRRETATPCVDVDLAGADRGEHTDRRVAVGGVGDLDGDAVAADVVLQLVGRALGDHPAVVDHDDPLGEPIGLVEVLRGEQHRGAVVFELLDEVPHRQPATRVEPGGRLVEEQHRRPGDQAHRDVEPPPHAAGVGLDDPVGGVDQVEPLEQLIAAPEALGLRHVEQATDVLHVLATGEPLLDGRVLSGEADAPADTVGIAARIDAVDQGHAGVGAQQRGEDPHDGGLARPVRTEQPVHRTVRDHQVDAVDGRRCAESLDEAARLYGVGGHDRQSGRRVRESKRAYRECPVIRDAAAARPASG